MLGLDRLVAMRMRGRVPRDGVCFHVDAARPRLDQAPEECDGRCVRVDVDPAERTSRADLRAVFGLRVFVLGEDAPACTELAKRCVECGASAVIAGRFQQVECDGFHLRAYFAHNPWVPING